MSDDATNGLEQALADLAGGHSGVLTVAARNLVTDEEVLLRPDEIMPTASVIKLPVLVELMRQAEAGQVSLDDRVELREDDKRGGSGILKVFDAGLRFTLRDAATLMIVLSDNTATNTIIDAVAGVDVVNAAMDELNLSTIRLHNRIDFELVSDDIRQLGETSARDMCALAHGIAERTVFGPDVSAAVERVLERQQYLDQAPRYVEVSPYAAELGLDTIISVANKTGFFTGTRADTGIFRFPAGGGFAYAMFHHESEDERFLAESEGSVLHGLVGKLLVEHWWPDGAAAAPTVSTPYAS
jgi:beta-lactamase class A